MYKLFNQKSIILIITMALFNYIFLCTEYMFDGMMGFVTDAKGVVNAQNIVLGTSLIGFLLFAKIDAWIKVKHKKIGAAICLACILVALIIMLQHKSYCSILIAGIAIYVWFGILGAAVCYYMSVDAYQEHLAKKVGMAYALGVLIQYISNNVVRNDLAEVITITVALCILVAGLLLVDPKSNASILNKQMQETEVEDAFVLHVELKSKVLAAITLTLCIAFTTCIFSTLDNAVTLVHANGDFDIGQWPRLILAASGLVAGCLFDISRRKFMSLFMYIITMLSTICIVIIQLGGSFVMGLIVFYVSAGFFVVYFCTSYMDLSHFMNQPKVWAGFGRAVNNISAFAVSALSVKLLAAESGMAIVVVAIVLFALINISVLLYISTYKAMEYKEVENITGTASNTENNISNNDEDEQLVDGEVAEEDPISKMVMFFDAYRFTAREREVFEALISSDDSVQDLAVKLAISRAALYRHLSNMNQKTETQNRIGLMQFYFDWIDKN